MSNIEKSKKSILQVLLWFNLIFIIVSIFYVTKGFTLMITIINVILLGTFFILDKNNVMFESLFMTNKIMKSVDNLFKEK